MEGFLRLDPDVLRDVPQFAIDWANETSFGDPRWGFGFDRLDYGPSGRIWLIGCRGLGIAPMFPLEPEWTSAEDLDRAFHDFFATEHWAIFTWTIQHNRLLDEFDFDRG